MYIIYFVYGDGEGRCGDFKENVLEGLCLRPSESIWIVPGTVSPEDDQMTIGNYEYHQLLSGRWEARRTFDKFIMGVFGSRIEAKEYCESKHQQERK